MILSFLPASLLSILLRRRPLIAYTATWTALLTVTVAAASFTPELAFVWAVSPGSAFSRCGEGQVRVPLEGPVGDVVCVPAQLFGRSKAVDFFVPPLFAALVVAGSAGLVRAVGLWEGPDYAEF